MKHYFRIVTMAVVALILTACSSKESINLHNKKETSFYKSYNDVSFSINQCVNEYTLYV